MKHWLTKSLGEVLEISRERIEPTEHPDTLFNYVGLESIEGHTGKLMPYQPTPGADIKSTKNVFHPGEILYGKLRPYLNKVHLASTEGICSTDIYVLRPRQRLVRPSFVANYLRSPSVLAVVSAAMAGANLPRIGQDSLLAVPVPVPPLAEQERTVNLLDKADELRKLRAQADGRAAALIPAIFHEMFGDPIMNTKSWPQSLFAEVGKLDRGRSKNRPRDEPSLYGGKYPFIQTGDVANANGVITKFSQTYSEKGFAQSRMWSAGTLVITIAANIGKTAILTFPACFPDSIVGFIPGDNVVVDYVRQWLVTIEDRLEEAAPQMAQKNINLHILSELKIPVPPLQLQKEFAERVASIRIMESRQAVSHQHLEALFQSMLQRAFSGDL